jgi:aryl-alcohol dehydrogenase-like predicted oxidoreductase
MAWLLARPAVTSIIVGARNEQQLGVALGALQVELSPVETDMLAQLF